MAISDAYATAAQYRTVVSKTDTGDDTDVDTDLTTVSRYLERYLGRFFNVDASDVTRLYVIGEGIAEPPNGHKTLWVDDLSAAPTTIKIDEDNDGVFTDETALASTDYELRPLNAPDGPEAKPYTHIYLPAWGDKSNWPHGLRVEIVGKWGWLAVPKPIERATIHVTALLRLQSPRATERIPDDLGGGGSKASQDAMSIIWKLARVYQRRQV